jgi:hypothetical protein
VNQIGRKTEFRKWRPGCQGEQDWGKIPGRGPNGFAPPTGLEMPKSNANEA